MPKGTLSQDAALTNVAVAYKNQNLIAPLVFPAVPVMKQSGKIYKFGKESFRLDDDLRAPGVPANKVQSFSVSSDSYFCDVHALHDAIAKEDIENADAAIKPEVAMTQGLTDKIALRREYVMAASIFNTTTFTSYYRARTGTDRWNDYTNSDPIGDIDYAKEQVRQSSGAKANVAIMGVAVYNKLKRHPDLLEMFKYTAGNALSEQQVAEALELEKILVGRAVYNSAKEGATAVMADIWGKYCMVAHIARQPGIMVPSLGYQYRWQTGVDGFKVYKTVKDEAGSEHATLVEVENNFDDVISGADFAYLQSTVID